MLPSLRAVQLLTAGYDDVLPLLPPGVTLSNAAGVHDASTAELAVALTLAALRGVPDMVRAQAGLVGPLGGRPALADKRVLVVGYGSIGQAVARRLARFEVTLTAVASGPAPGTTSSPRVHGDRRAAAAAAAPRRRGPHRAAQRGDHRPGRPRVPGAPAGRRPRRQRGARPGRRHGRPRGGDAPPGGSGRRSTSPTPSRSRPDHPLWSTPGVLITPHVGGDTSAFAPRAVRPDPRAARGAAGGRAAAQRRRRPWPGPGVARARPSVVRGLPGDTVNMTRPSLRSARARGCGWPAATTGGRGRSRARSSSCARCPHRAIDTREGRRRSSPG